MPEPSDGARRLTSSAAFRELDDALLRVTGADSRSWLSGQVTNDIRGLSKGGAVYTLVLDGRGKIVSDAWVLDRGDELAIVVPGDVLDALRTHLDKYIIMEDVELAPSDERVVTVAGPEAVERVRSAGLEGFPCDRLGVGGVDLVTSDPGAVRTALLASGLEEVDEQSWELTRLRLGRPRFGRDFGSAHYPQEAGLKELAVSFQKGCYLGQEVVCTLENRGQLSRRLVRLEGDETLASGDALRAESGVVGTVSSVVRDPDANKTLALAYVKRAAAVPGAVLRTGEGSFRIASIVGERSSGQNDVGAL